MHSLAVYDLIVDVLRGRLESVRRRRSAFDAPVSIWERVTTFEGCGARIDRAMSVAGLRPELPPTVRRMLRGATSTALRQAVLALDGLRDVAALAETHGVRVLPIKGAARLLGGELPGTRTMSDIDLLIDAADAAPFHVLLQKELGYVSSGRPYPHHLPALTRSGLLGIEIHHQLTDTPIELDDEMFHGTRVVMLEGHPIEIPSPTNMVLHTLEHAARLNWMVHYRLRDILDLATIFGPEVSQDDIRAYVRGNPGRVAFETLLSAAHELQPLAPEMRSDAWQTVRRVARTRTALAGMPHGRVAANRVFRYASVMAEGSPRAMMRAGVGLFRRMGTAVLPTAAILLAACSDTTSPRPLEVPAFLFVSDSAGTPGVYRSEDHNVSRLSDPDDADDQPHSAAGRIVFVSLRDGNPEIYIADLDLTGQQRLTSDGSTDGEPALDPTGATIAFVSRRSGTPRIWLMQATGANPRPLDTGSPTFTPEGAPAWSPSGDRIAFTSTRTNTSQVFVLNMASGQVGQLSHEAGGAFSPAWSADGSSVLYVSPVGDSRLMRIALSGGDPALVASGDRVLGDPACALEVCLAVAGADAGDGDIIALNAGRPSEPVLVRAENDRQPAFLVP